MEKREENTGLGVRVQGSGNAQNPKPDTQYPNLKDVSDVERIIEQVNLFCPNVAKLPKQLTEKEVNSLLGKYSKNEILWQLNQMENYRPLTQKYTSVYLTLLKWFELDKKKGFTSQRKETSSQPSQDLKSEFLKKYPIGTTLRSNTGRRFEVINSEFIEEMDERSLMPIARVLNKQFTILSHSKGVRS